MYHMYTAQPDFKNPPCICILLVRFWLCGGSFLRVVLELRQELGEVCLKEVERLLAFFLVFVLPKSDLLCLRALVDP
ncbi:hypothetical protein LJC10_06110 [Selenomonadales bacterium OttesenSCG-928-I06]|nr:hypothetical protein [Selenomonadales bacterium OttesenSCG-928-I06]